MGCGCDEGDDSARVVNDSFGVCIDRRLNISSHAFLSSGSAAQDITTLPKTDDECRVGDSFGTADGVAAMEGDCSVGDDEECPVNDDNTCASVAALEADDECPVGDSFGTAGGVTTMEGGCSVVDGYTLTGATTSRASASLSSLTAMSLANCSFACCNYLFSCLSFVFLLFNSFGSFSCSPIWSISAFICVCSDNFLNSMSNNVIFGG